MTDTTVLDVIFVSLINKDDLKKERQIVSLDKYSRIFNRLLQINNNIPENIEVKINAEELKESKYVKEIIEDSYVVLEIKKEEYEKLINDNQELYAMIKDIKFITDFEEKLGEVSDNTCFFALRNPNEKYELTEHDSGFEKDAELLYTDGEVTELETSFDTKRVSVDNATYVVLVKERNNEIIGALVIADRKDELLYEFLLDEIKDICKKRKDSYSESKTKPRVLKRRQHLVRPYLYHSIKFNNLDTLYKILDSGYILPRCMIEGSKSFDRNNIFNGTKYISLTKKDHMSNFDKQYFRSSYDEFVVGSLTIVIDKFNDIIVPNFIDMDTIDREVYRKLLFRDDGERNSYYLDEVQTDKKIPISNFIAIGYPNSNFEYALGTLKNKDQLLEIKEALVKHKLNIPIVNSDVYSFADDEENIKKYTLVK